MLILDDLDSMLPNAKERLLREIDTIDYDNLRILVALRQDTPLLQNWIRINVLPLETEQIFSYLKWDETKAPDERLPVFDLCRNNIRILKMFAQLKLTYRRSDRQNWIQGRNTKRTFFEQRQINA